MDLVVATPVHWVANARATDGPNFPSALLAFGFLVLPTSVILLVIQLGLLVSSRWTGTWSGRKYLMIGVVTGVLSGALLIRMLGTPTNITFGIVDDLKDYGALRNVMPQDIHAVTVRYYDGSFRDIQEVQRHLTAVLRSEKGSIKTHCPWAEALGVPAIEATIQFISGANGRLLLWRQGRLVYQDPGLKWWYG